MKKTPLEREIELDLRVLQTLLQVGIDPNEYYKRFPAMPEPGGDK